MILRPCQQEAVDEVYEYLRTKDTNPCVVLSTGTGKSLVLAKIASDAVTLWGCRVLILAYVKELLEQNADKVRRLCPGGNNLGNNLGMTWNNLGMMWNNEACPASFRALARPQLRRGIF